MIENLLPFIGPKVALSGKIISETSCRKILSRHMQFFSPEKSICIMCTAIVTYIFCLPPKSAATVAASHLKSRRRKLSAAKAILHSIGKPHRQTTIIFFRVSTKSFVVFELAAWKYKWPLSYVRLLPRQQKFQHFIFIPWSFLSNRASNISINQSLARAL